MKISIVTLLLLGYSGLHCFLLKQRMKKCSRVSTGKVVIRFFAVSEPWLPCLAHVMIFFKD